MPPPPDPLAAPATLAGAVLARLHPRGALAARVGTVLPGLGAQLEARAAASARRLRPVMAYPVFRDPLFEPLRELSQDYILPNVADLPVDSIALMKPNPRFIEVGARRRQPRVRARAALARVPDRPARDIVPRVLGHARRARGARAATTSASCTAGRARSAASRPLPASLLVLVVRGAAAGEVPEDVVFCAAGGRLTRATRPSPRVLDPAGEVRQPVLHGHLDPDIAIFGFDLDEGEARGDAAHAAPGWFFVFMERPGQPRFGLDSDGAAPALKSWDDLHWDHLGPANAEQVLVKANAGLVPVPDPPAAPPSSPAWGATAADMASVLFQSPVLLARHAAEMLPTPTSPPA